MTNNLTCLNFAIILLFVLFKGVVARLYRASRVKQKSSTRADYRGIPTHACPCGEQVFKVLAVFEDFEIVLYALDAECSACGALVTAPTPLEKNNG